MFVLLTHYLNQLHIYHSAHTSEKQSFTMPTAISPPSSRSSPVPTDIQPPRPSAATQNLIALSQDIAALLSLSIEATASLVHDVYRRTLGAVGWRPVTGYEPVSSTRSGGGEGGRGLAVVVVGAGEGELSPQNTNANDSHGAISISSTRQIRLYRIPPCPPPITPLSSHIHSINISPLGLVSYPETHQFSTSDTSWICCAHHYRSRDCRS